MYHMGEAPLLQHDSRPPKKLHPIRDRDWSTKMEQLQKCWNVIAGCCCNNFDLPNTVVQVMRQCLMVRGRRNFVSCAWKICYPCIGYINLNLQWLWEQLQIDSLFQYDCYQCHIVHTVKRQQSQNTGCCEKYSHRRTFFFFRWKCSRMHK